jgi:hypothetical protein
MPKSSLHSSVLAKRSVQLGVLAVVAAGLFFFTSAPFQFLQFWAQLNGFEAEGFSGRLLSHIEVRRFADENSKRRIEINDARFEFTLWPEVHVRLAHVGRLVVTRPKPQKLYFAKTLSGVTKVLATDFRGPKKMIKVDQLEIRDVQLSLFENAPPLMLERASVQGLQLGPGHFVDMKRAEIVGENIQGELLGGKLDISLQLPKEYFGDIVVDLDLKLFCQFGAGASCRKASFFKDQVTLAYDVQTGAYQDTGRFDFEAITASPAAARTLRAALAERGQR